MAYQEKKEQKKRILLIVPSLQQGGFQRVCVRTALLLKDTHEVTIAIFNGEERAFDVGGIPVLDLALKSKPGKVQKVCNVFRRVHKLKQLKRKLHIDIAYSFGTTANLSNVLSKTGEWNWAGLRSYVDVNAFEMKIICRRADLLISCSKMIEKEIKEKYPVKEITTVYNPFNIMEMQNLANQPLEAGEYKTEEEALWQRNTEEEKILITMGREDDLKGYWHLLKSFALALKQYPAMKLVFLGRGEFIPYKQLARDLKIEDKVYFLGTKKNPFPYLKRADLYVLSSVHEGFPNALVEAMSVGLPVISTNCKSGPAEILTESFSDFQDKNEIMQEKYGILVPAMQEKPNFQATEVEKEESVLADAIVTILKDDVLLCHYQEQAQKRVIDFSNEAYVEELLKIERRD